MLTSIVEPNIIVLLMKCEIGLGGGKMGRAPSACPLSFSQKCASRLGRYAMLCILSGSNTTPRDKFIEIWRPAGSYVKAHESIALSYKLSKSDKDPLSILVFERLSSSRHSRESPSEPTSGANPTPGGGGVNTIKRLESVGCAG